MAAALWSQTRRADGREAAMNAVGGITGTPVRGVDWSIERGETQLRWTTARDAAASVEGGDDAAPTARRAYSCFDPYYEDEQEYARADSPRSDVLRG